MVKDKEISPLKFFTVLVTIKKLSIRKIWIGLAFDERDALIKVIDECLKELKVTRNDIFVEGTCYLNVGESITEINKIHEKINKQSNNANLPLYREEKTVLKKIKIKENKTKQKKNILIKEIISEKNKKKFNNNIKKFNKAEKRYIIEKIN